jgi:thiol-disulfide isomerase/thioredoxin
MKLVTLFTALILGFVPLYSASSASSDTAKPVINELDVFNTNTVKLSNYRGKVILVNFWATWCPPCQMETPDLVALQTKYKGKLQVIGVSVDDQRSLVPDFYKEKKINYPVIMTTKDVEKEFPGINALPSTFLINTKGEIVKKIVGFRNYAAYEAEIKPYLSK